MGDEGQSIHLIAVEQHIYLDQFRGAVIIQFVVQTGVTLGAGLQGVKEVVDDLTDGHGVVQLTQGGVQVLHVLEDAAALLTQGHDVAHIVGGCHDGHVGVGLLGSRDGAYVGVVVGVIHHDDGAVGLGDLVNDRGHGGDQVQIELALQTFLNDLHVEHTQKSAAEAETQSGGRFRLEGQGGVVELQFFQRVAQVGVLGAIFGINTAVDHGTGGAVAGQGLGGRAVGLGDGVTHLSVLDVLDGGGEVADLAGNQFFAGLQTQR